MSYTLWQNKFFRFLIIGGINTLFGYSVYAVLIILRFDYRLAILLATILGVLFNFKTTGVIVFENKQNILIFKFIGVYTIIYFINVFLVKYLLNIGFGPLISGAIIILPVAFLSFLFNRYLVFGG